MSCFGHNCHVLYGVPQQIGGATNVAPSDLSHQRDVEFSADAASVKALACLCYQHPHACSHACLQTLGMTGDCLQSNACKQLHTSLVAV